MTDREKVIKGLRHCTALDGLYECYPKIADDCPYVNEADCKLTIMREALELLKEQEAVEPILDSFLHKRCPSCRTLLKGKYCHECGQAVKWE